MERKDELSQQEVFDEFRRRTVKLRYVAAVVYLLSIGGIFVVMKFQHGALWVAVIVSFGVLIIGASFGHKIWSCPVCCGKFGKMNRIKFCPHCGVMLVEGAVRHELPEETPN